MEPYRHAAPNPVSSPTFDNDDLGSWGPTTASGGGSGADDGPITIIVVADRSDRSGGICSGLRRLLMALLHLPMAVANALHPWVEWYCPFLLHFSSYTLGVLLILCVTVIWVASSNWIQYIFGTLEFNKPYFLTYFNTTGFSLWNMGYYLFPAWGKVPWDDTERPQAVLVEDPYIIVADEYDAAAAAAAATTAGGEVVVEGRHRPSPSPRQRRLRQRRDRQRLLRRQQQQQQQLQQQRGEGPVAAGAEDEMDIRVWAIRNGYDRSTLLFSDDSDADTVSAEEIVKLGSTTPTGGHGGGSRGASGPVVVAADSGSGGGSGRPDAPDQPHASTTSSAAGESAHTTTTTTQSQQQQQQQQQLPRRRGRVERLRPYSRRKIWFWAGVFCPFWFFANYLFNVSLSITSVASNTILSSTSSVWTLFLSYALLSESLGPLKWVAVALCLSGSVMVGVSDGRAAGDGDKNTVVGDIVALVSAFFYAVYTSILRFGLPDDERYAMGMVFGAVGIVNFLCFWPGLVLVDLVSLETFLWPSVAQFWPLVLNAVIGTNLSDVLWARSVVLTSPVVATLGLSLTTPLAMVVDAMFRGASFSGLYVAGAVMVMCGFIMVNVPYLERWPDCLRF